MNKIKIRDYKQDDYAFVKSSWIKNQAVNMPFKMMQHRDFFATYSPIIDTKMNEIKILIACNPECEDQTFAYIAFEKNILHFIYTKNIYRNFQIAKELFIEASKDLPFTYYTHLSDNKSFRNMTKRHRMIYSPFLFWETNEDND